MFVVVSIPGGEPHAGVVGHGVRQVPRQVAEVQGVVGGRTPQGDLVLRPAPLISPVLQVDTEDGGSRLAYEAVDLPQTEPELPWKTQTPRMGLFRVSRQKTIPIQFQRR